MCWQHLGAIDSPYDDTYLLESWTLIRSGKARSSDDALRRRNGAWPSRIAAQERNGRTMNILHVSCSPREHSSDNYWLARKIIKSLLA
jgi:hypothetical protein